MQSQAITTDSELMTASDKRDIMDELLKGTGGEMSEELDELNKLIHREVMRAKAEREAQQAEGKKTGRKRPKKDQKRKTTHYISEELFDDLDDAKARINQLMQKHLKAKISKSKIVDQALKMILKDFEEKGEKSPLIQEILKDIFKE